jgi:hypothetical protein
MGLNLAAINLEGQLKPSVDFQPKRNRLTLLSSQFEATRAASAMATKDEKEETPVDTRDALEVLESEAKEWDKVRATQRPPSCRIYGC